MGLSIGERKLVAKALKTTDQWWRYATGNLWTSFFLFYLTRDISRECASLRSIETIVRIVCMFGFKWTWEIAKRKIKYVAKSVIITSYIVGPKKPPQISNKMKVTKIHKCTKLYFSFLKWSGCKIISFQEE